MEEWEVKHVDHGIVCNMSESHRFLCHGGSIETLRGILDCTECSVFGVY